MDIVLFHLNWHLFCHNLMIILLLFYSPEMAESSSFDVEEGDIILLGTDGLFDNMNEDMILDCLSKMKVHNLLYEFSLSVNTMFKS